MKTRDIIWWIILLILIDQATKIVIYHFYMDTHFDIIPSLFEFRPVFNDKHSYVNYLLNQKLNVNMGFWIHMVIFAVAECIILALYVFFRSLSKKDKAPRHCHHLPNSGDYLCFARQYHLGKRGIGFHLPQTLVCFRPERYILKYFYSFLSCICTQAQEKIRTAK